MPTAAGKISYVFAVLAFTMLAACASALGQRTPEQEAAPVVQSALPLPACSCNPIKLGSPSVFFACNCGAAYCGIVTGGNAPQTPVAISCLPAK